MLNFIMCSVNIFAKGWTAALSWGNIKFVRFGLIFSGTWPDSSNVCGYQGYIDHAGKTRIPVTWSQHIFLMTFMRRLNQGNIYMKRWLQFIEMTSTAKDSGSGFQETYFLVCLLIRLENKSIFGVPKVSYTALYILGFNCHSVVSWNFLECLSASKLYLLGMFAALLCKSVLVPQIQISFAILLQSWDFRPPFLSIHDMAVVLSYIILICLKLLSLQ